MLEMKMPKSVLRVTIVKPEGETVVYSKPKKGKRKDSTILKPLRKAIRRSIKAQQVFANEYLDRFDQSSEKKKNGWLRDAPKNVFKATRKGLKEFQ